MLFRSISGLGALLLAACVSEPSGRTYAGADTRTAFDVAYGEVVEVRVVKIEGTATGIGTWGGASVGHAVGTVSASGSVNGWVGGAVGGIAGAVAGQAIERKLREDEALEITLRMDDADMIAVVQAGDVLFEPGERVRVLFGRDGSARVSAL